MAHFAGAMLGLLVALILALLFLRSNYGSTGKRVCVVVLGDFGRSPRMQFHTASLARHGCSVDVIAYDGTAPHAMVRDNPRIACHALPEPPRLPAGLPRACFLLYAPFKVVLQTAALGLRMLAVPRPSHVLVQNPPAIPTLAVAALVCAVRGSTLVVDWHNFGYTILAIGLGSDSPLVRIHEWYERVFGRLGAAHFCVTEAMRDWLRDNWRIAPRVLYDRAPDMFHIRAPADRHKLFQRLSAQAGGAFDAAGAAGDTLFTEARGGGVGMRAGRPAVIVSGTSWTADEDFGILFAALELYEARARAGAGDGAEPLPNVVCIITGKGPMRAHYEAIIAQTAFKHVAIHTMWLAAEDYPALLGSADVGVSLHYSSSGLDLPMKVVDMFGSGLPVCAIDFNCLHELVRDGENGLVFRDSAGLAECLVKMLRGFDGVDQTATLRSLRAGVESFQAVRWDASWDKVAAPVFNIA